MPVLTTTTRCTDADDNLTCCEEDSEGYWRVVDYEYVIAAAADCTTIATLNIDNGCYFGTPFQVLTSAVSGAIVVVCPGCPPLPAGNCVNGENYCGASSAYSVPGIFGNPARMAFSGFQFRGDTAIATMMFEDCRIPLNQKDVTFLFNMEKCSP